MASWSEDVAQFTSEQVLASRIENRAWHKELRQQSNRLMDSKLAKQMTHEDYAIERKLGNEATAECQRRGGKKGILATSANGRTTARIRLGFSDCYGI